MFWTFAAAALFAAALITLSPLLRTKSIWQPIALALVFLLPAGAAWMYTQIGTPAAINLVAPRASAASAAASTEAHSPDSQQMDAMIEGLRTRLEQNPDDLDGWMLLARTLRATQQFDGSLAALEKANQLSPDNPYIVVDIVETQIYMRPDGNITPEMTETLKQVLAVQPGMQKALWLLGIASSQEGDNATAITYWETLLEQVEPGSSVANSLQSQINAAKAQLGMSIAEAPASAEPAADRTIATDPVIADPVAAEPAAAVDDGAWQGIKVTVKADESSQSSIPAGGVLYVMIRSPGPAMGPPIGVRRIIGPSLPLEITVSDQDSMLQERQLSAESEVQFQARISLTGSPGAKPGDWQSIPVVVPLDSTKTVELVINQRVE